MFRIEAGDLEFEDGWEDDLLRQVAEEEAANMQNAISELRCPVHGEGPTIRGRQKPEKPGWKLHSCCDRLGDLAQARLIEAGFAQKT